MVHVLWEMIERLSEIGGLPWCVVMIVVVVKDNRPEGGCQFCC